MNRWDAPDPGFKTRVHESFQLQPFMQTLGMEISRIEPGYCEMKLNFRPALTQQHGYFHAGVIATMADNSAGYAAYSLMQAGSEVLSVEFKVNLLSPGKGESLIARAAVIKNGRTLTICQSEIFNQEQGQETLCAIATVSLMELKDNKKLYK